MPDATLRQALEPLVTTTFRVGRRFKVAMTIPSFGPGETLAMNVEWSPDVPKRRLNKREIQDYRRGRDAALAEVARLIGGNVLCVEV
jgi:hypothetical protein